MAEGVTNFVSGLGEKVVEMSRCGCCPFQKARQ
jgi:hypothetical protein